jgi:hypothetical protein
VTTFSKVNRRRPEISHRICSSELKPIRSGTLRKAKRCKILLAPDQARQVGDDLRLHVLRCLARLVRLDLGQLRRDATLGFQSVIGILQPQEIAFRQAEELAETQIGITCDGAGPIDDGVDAIARNANRMRELVLAHADWV